MNMLNENSNVNWSSHAESKIPKDAIQRDTVIETIEAIFTSETILVCIEGDEGCGSTTAMAQFAKKMHPNSFSVFLNPASKISYSADYVRLVIAEQIKFFIDGKSLEKEAIDEGSFQALLFKLRSKLKSTTGYFIIDGLGQIPKEDEYEVRQILKSVLPIGMDCFRFLISGDLESFRKHINSVKSKPYQLMRFTTSETEAYFSGTLDDEVSVRDIYQACRGNPGKLASIKRQLLHGKSLESILDGENGELPDFISKEFESERHVSNKSRLILSVITFSRQLLTAADIAEICEIEVDEVSKEVQKRSYLQESNGVIEFYSNAHRKYAEILFKDMQGQATDLQIKSLIKNPRSNTALLFLPAYFQQKKNDKELIGLIENNHYCALLETTESMLQLKQRAEIGLKSAQSIDEAISIFRFAMQKSLFIDLLETETSTKEINALVSLEKPGHALSLASQAVTVESRLSLLAAYASAMTRKGLMVSIEIMDRIKELSNKIEFSDQSGDFCERLADDLIAVDASLAAEIMEKSLSSIEDPAARDYAAARFNISVNAGMGGEKNKNGMSNIQIKNEAVRNFSHSLTRYYENHNIDEITNIAETLSSDKKITFLKLFLKDQKSRSGILDLVSYALDSMVKESSYTPKASDYADMASPLRFQEAPRETIETIIARFDAQLGLIRGVSVSRDYIRLAISLAHAEAAYDKPSANKRILDAYFETADLSNADVKAECCANILNALSEVDSNNEFERKEGMKFVINSDLEESLEDLLSKTAYNYDCVESILPAIAKYDLEKAVDIAGTINTEINRDRTFSLLSRIIVSELEFDPSKRDRLDSILGRIVSRPIFDEAITGCCDGVRYGKDKEKWADTIRPHTSQMESVIKKARCLIYLSQGASEVEKPSLVAELESVTDLLLQRSESTGERNDVCFSACDVVADINKDSAEKIYASIVHQRSKYESDNAQVQIAFYQCLSLVIRAFGAGLKAKLIPDDMLDRLILAIEKISCIRKRMTLYSDLAIRAWRHDRLDVSKRISENNCKLLLNEAKGLDLFTYRSLLIICYPTLYISHPNSAANLLIGELESVRDFAFQSACELIRSKIPPLDPASSEDSYFNAISYNDAIDVLSLLENMSSDTMIASEVEELCNAITSKKSKGKITGNQKKEISDKIISIVNKKLPQQKNIKHPGYKIVSIAKAYELVETKMPEWSSLCVEAEKIENISDRAYVLIRLSNSISKKFTALRGSTFEKAVEACQSIPSVKDRISRMHLISKVSAETNVATAKSTLKSALSLSHELIDKDDASEYQKALINLADQIDPEFADDMLEILDSDPARIEAKHEAKSELDLIRTKRDLADSLDSNSTDKLNLDLFPEASWRNLAALLSDRIETKPLEILGSYLSKGSSLGLTGLYPSLCWYIENAARKYISISDASSKILPMCESLLVSSELAFAVVDMRPRKIYEDVSSPPDSSGIMVKPEGRDDAIRYLEEWLENRCDNYIKICDPYFCSDDLLILKLIKARVPKADVSILTCTSTGVSQTEFQAAWRKISDQSPPNTYVMSVSTDTGKKPIHDRWIISSRSGLRIGTSFNSLGNRLSEISEMRENERQSCEVEIDKYLSRKVSIQGVRIKSVGFDI